MSKAQDNLIDRLQQTVSFLKSKTAIKPDIGVVLGSGLGAFVKNLETEVTIPFSDIPNFEKPSVDGHQGNLIFGKVGSKNIIALQGRLHYYEGHSMDSVVFPIRVMAFLGVQKLLLTNSSGGLGDGMAGGDFMIIEDHINLVGTNPLMGPNVKELGPRFPDMTDAYDKNMISLLEKIFLKNKIQFHKGIYGGLSGPTYETPAEVRFLKMIGCSAVGMSTVAENIAANHLGLRVAGLSCITNLAAGISKHKLSHEEVTDTARRVEQNFSMVVRQFLEEV
jgi:purine-nucleoside phosphorylase